MIREPSDLDGAVGIVASVVAVAAVAFVIMAFWVW